MQRKRSRLALLGVLALALSVSAGMTVSEVAAARRRVHRGLLASKVTAGRKFAGAKIKDLNVQVSAMHQDLDNLFIQLVGANGNLITLFDGTDNNLPGTTGPPFFSGGRAGTDDVR